LGVGAAFGLWYIRIGAIIMAWYWSTQIVGEYAAAFRVFEITYMFPAAIMSISVPHLSASLKKGRDWFLRDMNRLAAGMIGFAAIWAAFLYFGNPLIIRGLYGTRYNGAAPYLALMASVGGMVFLTYMATSMMVVLDLQKRHALNEGLAFIVGLLLNVALIPTIGGFGAVYALLGTELFRLVITTASLFRQWRLSAIQA
jgi:O-antigen/teichoic acid export membrane protein